MAERAKVKKVLKECAAENQSLWSLLLNEMEEKVKQAQEIRRLALDAHHAVYGKIPADEDAKEPKSEPQGFDERLRSLMGSIGVALEDARISLEPLV